MPRKRWAVDPQSPVVHWAILVLAAFGMIRLLSFVPIPKTITGVIPEIVFEVMVVMVLFWGSCLLAGLILWLSERKQKKAPTNQESWFKESPVDFDAALTQLEYELGCFDRAGNWEQFFSGPSKWHQVARRRIARCLKPRRPKQPDFTSWLDKPSGFVLMLPLILGLWVFIRGLDLWDALKSRARGLVNRHNL